MSLTQTLTCHHFELVDRCLLVIPATVPDLAVNSNYTFYTKFQTEFSKENNTPKIV